MPVQRRSCQAQPGQGSTNRSPPGSCPWCWLSGSSIESFHSYSLTPARGDSIMAQRKEVMKNSRIALLVLGILLLPAFVFARPQVAVLDTILAAGMDKTVAAPITDKIIEELVNSGKYTVIDRANVEQGLREKAFQLSSGVVKNEEVRQ